MSLSGVTEVLAEAALEVFFEGALALALALGAFPFAVAFLPIAVGISSESAAGAFERLGAITTGRDSEGEEEMGRKLTDVASSFLKGLYPLVGNSEILCKGTTNKIAIECST